MVDSRGERDAQGDEVDREHHWPEEEGGTPGTEEGTTPAAIMPAVVGGASPSGQLPVAAGPVETPDAVATTPAEGEETGDPDEWRVPRDDLFPPDEDKG